MRRTHLLNVLVAILLVAILPIAGSGCSPKPINRETLNYFYGLVNQQYWQRQASGLALNDEYGTEELILAPQGMSAKEQYVVFGDVAVTSSSQKSGPTDAVIKVKVFDGTTEKEVRARVDDANRATLERMLAETFESKAQREQRLKGEEYAVKFKEADALLAANKVADAIAALKAAQAVNDTDEVKAKLDAIYLKQGKYYYAQKNYEVALERLRLVTSDSASITEAIALTDQISADIAKAAADKAATEKATADKVAAEKATADKVAAEKAAIARAGVDKATGTWKLVGFKGQQVNDVLVDPRSPNKIFAVHRGAYCSLDYGKSWKSVSEVTSYAIAMDAFDSQTLYLAAYNGMYRSRNGGTTWTGVYVGSKGTRFRSLCADPNQRGVVYAGVDSVGIVKYTDYATNVDPITLNFLDHYPHSVDLRVQSLAVDPTNSQRLYVGTIYDLYRSNDGGETWHGGAQGTAANGSFHLISSLAVSDQGVVFASIGSTSWPRPKVDDSGLFRSTNHGESWSRISTGLTRDSSFPSPMINKVCFNPRNSSEIFAATDTGVYRTTDSGKTWKRLGAGFPADANFVYCLALDPLNPHLLYAGTDEGLYRFAF